MTRYLLPSLFAATAMYVQAAEPMADAWERLLNALEKEVEALEQMQSPQDVDNALLELRDAVQTLATLAATVDEKELWQYIDNTADKKQPLVDVLSQLALEFSRIEMAGYFNNGELKTLLAPQIEETSDIKNAKLEKIRVADDDDD